MSAEVKKEIAFEIAHVLFIDIVGYSKLLINEQRELLQQLNQIVRGTDQFRSAEAGGQLIRIPAGDGMALVFNSSPEAPVECALEISRALKKHPKIYLRMGVHSGPISGVVDVNDQANVAGAGINTARRVMDCGEAGHILLSNHVAEDLEQYQHWRPHLHDLGECELKHGSRAHVFNLYTADLGNPEPPQKFRQSAGKNKTVAQRIFDSEWTLISVILVSALVIGLAIFWPKLRKLANASDRAESAAATLGEVPEKSIAVLPFENLSADPQNAFFTDGVQDEILTDLAKVADLRVISRTSVMQYKSGTTRNLREIAKQLGVAHVLEGSVRRAANRVRVSATLIDARTDAQMWAQRYDRPLDDVFAIQSEIAQAITEQLKAKISPAEKTAIEQRATSDLVAYDFYVRAKVLLNSTSFSTDAKEKYLEATRLLDDAVARDPSFFLAYYQLAYAHDRMYFFGYDHTAARLSLAERAVQTALRLRPDAGEAHLALAQHLYRGYGDYARARDELAIARRALPNDSLVYELTGYIDRRQGAWDESTRNLEKALELDPRNLFILQQISISYQKLRRFAEQAAVLDRALALVPKDIDTRTVRAEVELDWRADPGPLTATIETILNENPDAAESIAENWFILALCKRDAKEMTRALAALHEGGINIDGVIFPRAWCEGMAARVRGDNAAALAAFTAARAEVAKTVREQPNYAQALCVLGMIDAALGRNSDALSEGRRAVDLLPVARDSVNGAHMIEFFAVTCAWAGEKDLACEQLALATQIPGDISYGQLRLSPYWDPLRGDPRFEKIVASLAPK